MKHRLYRWTALLLVFVMTICTPLTVLAEVMQPKAVQQLAEIEREQSNEFEIEAENSFGTLLLNSMEADGDQETNYGILDVVLEANMATVYYATDCEDAYITVAVYDEFEPQLLASGTVKGDADKTQASVEIEGNIPEYFLVKVYLTKYNGTPIADEYVCDRYTKEVQDFLNKSVEDFPEHLVVNFDENVKTNFAVYHDDVVLIDEVQETGQTYLEQEGEYVFENPNDAILALKNGDVVALTSEENEVVYMKVASIQNDGQRIKITEDPEIVLEDVFQVVKFDSSASSIEASLDMGEADEGVTYMGQSIGTYALRDSSEPEDHYKLELNVDEDSVKCVFKIKDENASASIDLLSVMDWKYSHSTLHSYKDINYKCNITINTIFSAGVEQDRFFKRLGEINYYLCGGVVRIVESLDVIAKVEASIATEVTTHTLVGIQYDKALEKLIIVGNPPESELSRAEIDGKFFIGLQPELVVSVINKKLAAIKLNMQVGGTINAASTVESESAEQREGMRHDCDICINGSFAVTMSATLTGNILGLKSSVKWEPAGLPVGEFYWSQTYDEFEFDFFKDVSCPHLSYLVAIQVKDPQGQGVPNVAIKGTRMAVAPVTDENGQVECWLPEGAYPLSVETFAANGDLYQAKYNLIVKEEPLSINMQLVFVGEGDVGGSNYGDGTYEYIVDEDRNVIQQIITNNRTGDQFVVYMSSNGTLIINGSGVMPCVHIGDVAWDNASAIYFSDGITEINANGYCAKASVKSIRLPNTLKVINGFDRFPSIEKLILPESVEKIGFAAFSGNLFKEVVIPGENVDIGIQAFAECPNLEKVTILGSNIKLGRYAFLKCGNLEYVKMPDTIEMASDGSVFGECGLKTVEFFKGKGNGSSGGIFSGFAECHNLEEITIPGTFSSIDSMCFWRCSSLKKVIIEDGVKTIGAHAFSECTNLETVIIGDSVEYIDWAVFWDCPNLKTVKLPKNLKVIGDFAGILGDVLVIPAGIEYICWSAFSEDNTQFIYEGSADDWKEIKFGGTIIDNGVPWGGVELMEACGLYADKLTFLGGGTLEEPDNYNFRATTSLEEALVGEIETEPETEPEEEPEVEEEPEPETEPEEEPEVAEESEPETEPEEEPEVEEESEPETEPEEEPEEEPEVEEEPEPETEPEEEPEVAEESEPETEPEEEPEVEEEPEPETESEEEPEVEEEIEPEDELEVEEEFEEKVTDMSGRLYREHLVSQCEVSGRMRHIQVEGEGSTHRTSYNNLIPGAKYLYAAVKNRSIHWSEPSNLLYLEQKTAGSSGILQFTYKIAEDNENFFDYLSGEQAGDPAKVMEVILSQTEITLYEGGASVQLLATVLPEEADDTTLRWWSDNPAVAIVDNNGIVKPIGVGTTRIRVLTANGNLADAECLVTVEEMSQENKIVGFVQRCYSIIQGREADVSGLEYWTNSLLHGEQGGASLVQQFISSSEFKEKGYTNEEIVKIVYQTMLDRQPDNSGLAYWVECLNEGVSPEYVVSGFAGSEEFIQICNSYGIQAGILTLSQSRDQNIKVTGFVNRCYRLILERKGDEDGLNFWSRFLLDHYYGGGEIVQQLINSNEFIARGLSDTEFIELMYLTMLDREADAGGKAVWVEHLDFGMSKNYVISCFVYSEEFMNICDEYGILNGVVELNENRDINPQITKFVNRCYRETLGRKWDVDGLNSWTGILLKGEMSPNQVAKSFVFSEEVLNKKLTDDQFVKILYKVYMGREADEAGLNYWIGQIQTGTSWNDMVDQFSNTEEFWEIEEAYGFYREGWHIVDGNLRYYGTDGKPVTNCWKKKEDDWYYLGDAGDVVRNEIIRERSADWYYVDSDGKMVEDQWIALPSGDFRYDYETDFYYADSSGKLARSSWKKIQGVFYYFDQDGICVGNRIVVDKQGQYYLKPLPDASLLTDSNLIYEGIVYKADQDGKLTVIRFSEGWYMSDGEWYYYDAYGNVVVNQWKMIGDDWYYLGPKGKLEKNKVIKDGTGWYYVNSAGIMVSNQWIALDSETHRYGFETDFYYAKASGKLVRDNMLTIDERTYYFDHDGICVGDLIITHEGNQYYFLPLPEAYMLKNGTITYQGVTFHADEEGKLQK